MRFINKLSYSCAKGLSQMLDESHQKKAEYYYGFQIAFGSITKTAILVAVSLTLGVLIPALIVALTFGLLRKVAGGCHMNTYGRCLVVTIGLFVAAALLARHTYQYWNIAILVILITLTFTIALYVLIKYAPKDTPNRLITDPKEKRKFKTLSIIYIFAWLALIIILAKLGMRLYILLLCFSVLLELFGITPLGCKFFNKIEHSLTSE